LRLIRDSVNNCAGAVQRESKSPLVDLESHQRFPENPSMLL
jgi:hypothetical protein